jgi:hypothetical protein
MRDGKRVEKPDTGLHYNLVISVKATPEGRQGQGNHCVKHETKERHNR